MGTVSYPYPGDSWGLRARRIARAYREATLADDPAAECARIDRLCADWGERWIVPQPETFDLDDWLTPAQVADAIGVSVATVRQLRGRGRLLGYQDSAGCWRYRYRDALAVMSATRKRKRPA